MNWNRIRGSWRQFTGGVKERLGKVKRDKRMVQQGQRDQFAGKLEEGYGVGKEKIEKAADALVRKRSLSDTEIS